MRGTRFSASTRRSSMWVITGMVVFSGDVAPAMLPGRLPCGPERFSDRAGRVSGRGGSALEQRQVVVDLAFARDVRCIGLVMLRCDQLGERRERTRAHPEQAQAARQLDALPALAGSAADRLRIHGVCGQA